MPESTVIKYGGGALKDHESFSRAAYHQAVSCSPVAVTSAMYGITNRLLNIYEKGAPDSLVKTEFLNCYWDVAKYLPREFHDLAMNELKVEMERVTTFLDARNRHAFIGAGEGHSAILLKYHIQAIKIPAFHRNGPDAGFLLDDHGIIDVEKSRDRLLKSLTPNGTVAVIGGYLGRHYRTEEFQIGSRNSTDAFAAVIAAVIGAKRLEIIKDVPGVYSVPMEYGKFGIINNLSYNEAEKMSDNGSPVVHPSAISIARKNNIPIVVKNLESPGTTISHESQTTPDRFVAALVPEKIYAITVLDDLIGSYEGMKYIPHIIGFEERFGTDISVISSKRGWFSYMIRMGDKKRGEDISDQFSKHKKVLEEYLVSEGYHPSVQGEEVGVITVVGDGMKERKGTFASLSKLLADKGISVRSAIQGDENYTLPDISLVFDADKLKPATETLAKELFRDLSYDTGLPLY